MLESSPASRIQANLKELFQGNSISGDAYIRFQLTTELDTVPSISLKKKQEVKSDITALLSMEHVQESLVVEAERITLLPNMPESVLGIMTTHNRVFCVFDLAQLLKLRFRTTSPQKYQVIVMQTIAAKPIYIGLAVSHLQGIVRLSTKEIKSSLKGLPPNITPYLYGTVEFDKTIIPILDFNRISVVLIKLNSN